MLRSLLATVGAGIAIAVGCGTSADGPPLVGGPPDAAAGSNAGDASCTSAPAATPNPLDPSTLPSCCTTGAAHCVPKDDVDPSLAPQLAPCTGGYCEPDPIIENPALVPATCKSLNNAPGACVSVCVPQVIQYLSILPQATCAPDERCAPCINPLDNSNTGACDVGKHTGGCGPSDASGGGSAGEGGVCPYTGPPIIDPTTFPDCTPACAGSHCVPAALVPAAQKAQLTACPSSGGATGFCAPDSLTASGGNGLPPSCTSVAGAEGRCLSVCIPLVASKEVALPQATCAATERCAPCFDPTATDPTAATGACSIACDAAKMPPTVLACPYTGPAILDPSVFPACAPACGGAHCVPAALVPASQQSQLATCAGGFCTPDTLSASGGKAVPKSCSSVGGAEGRCLSECIPLVASKEIALPQATCAAGERCAPCFDPTATDPTAPTGACSVACDTPAMPPTILPCPYTGPPILDPSVFPACAPACGGAHCVPAALVPASQQSQLATCAGGFCTPDSLSSSGGKAVPKTCTSAAGAEGRCLSTCLPLVAAKASILPQDVCAASERCAPCYDPTAADPTVPTGACSVACDKPAKPPTLLTCPWTGPPVVDPSVFPACAPACAGAHCVPAALVPASQQSQLAACPGGFCTPDPIASSDDHYVPPACQPFGDPASEGRCTSDCLPSVQAQSSQLVQATCASGNLCAPCTDPFKGTSTGACALACDAPKKPPFTFPLCCSYQGQNQGTCVPKSLVPSGQQASLNQNVCPTNAASYLCVPDEYLPNPPYPYQTCNAGLLGKGTCVSQCATIPLGGVGLSQGTCPGNHLCVPCSLAPAGTPGC
jgi:hypothetical protein